MKGPQDKSRAASTATAASKCLAYLITFRCYGTWLHGDERGSVNRHQNQIGAPVLNAEESMRADSTKLLKHNPIELSESMRSSTEATIREVCAYRNWILHAISVRSHHVHCVVTAPQAPEKVMTDLKAWSTRRLREAGLVTADTRLWERHGSTRYLWRDDAVQVACRYVVEGQGGDLS